MANIDERIAQMQAQLRQLQASARKQKRRDETRRKILYGAAVLKFVDDLEAGEKERRLARLHKYVTRESDRRFLGLSPLTAQSNSEPEHRRVASRQSVDRT